MQTVTIIYYFITIYYRSTIWLIEAPLWQEGATIEDGNKD